MKETNHSLETGSLSIRLDKNFTTYVEEADFLTEWNFPKRETGFLSKSGDASHQITSPKGSFWSARDGVGCY